MKRINFNKRPTPVARRSSRATCETSTNACGDWWWLCLYPLVSLPDVARSLLECLCPLQSLCLALSSGVNHNASARMATPPISVPCRQPDLGVQYHPWSKVDIRGQPLLPHSMGREQGWGYLRSTPRFGVFWFIPPLLSKPIFGQPPLYEDFPWYAHRVGVTWVQAGFTGLSPDV